MNNAAPGALGAIRELIAAGRHQEAMPLLDGLLSSDQHGLEALRLLAECQILEGQVAEACASLQFCLLCDPGHGPTLVSLARLLWQNDQLEAALVQVRSLLALEPEGLEECLLLVRILHDAEQFDQALQVCDHVLHRHGDAAEAWFARAMVLQCQGLYAQAIEAYGRALELQSDWHQAAVNRGLLRLLGGDALHGGHDYERRWLLGELDEAPVVGLPPWDGQPCQGTVLLWAEQGLGDELFWLGFLSAWVPQAQRLALLLDARLVGLVARHFPGITVLPRTAKPPDLPDVVAALPLASLPWLLARRQQPLPLPFKPWLREEQPGPAAGPGRLGLFWRSFQPQRGLIKSIHLLDLAPLAMIPGLELRSLQYGDASEALAAFTAATGTVIQPPDFDPFHDIEQLIAAIATCDGVVTIPSVVAHLCGALGVPCVVLSASSRARPWYWEGDGDSCPWYPSVRVWRCPGRSALPQQLEHLSAWANGLLQQRNQPH